MACNLWIRTHNEIYDTSWMTSGSRRKPYANWAFPGIARPYLKRGNTLDPHTMGDSRVLDTVTTCVDDTLECLFPGHRRRSDEHNSDENDDDLHEVKDTLARIRRMKVR
ncbi:hypothetical protein QCA50_004644 [Cerrena zonata]|uniref:Uncharacterized protein n=1 Tax=Cerrena zonata TaxID=2478898 RepID=A0AAW0GD11_9APHY